jgi:hypothetical protein
MMTNMLDDDVLNIVYGMLDVWTWLHMRAVSSGMYQKRKNAVTDRDISDAMNLHSEINRKSLLPSNHTPTGQRIVIICHHYNRR